jgi:very-short-patch-repair endonuclease
MRRKTPQDYHLLAKGRNFIWIGPKVSNTKTPTNWKCPHGHIFESRYSDIKQGHGCIECSGIKRKTPADYRALAEKRDFTWIGPPVSNNQSKTGWQCQHGHNWKATYGNIQQGSGCPYCAGKAPKTESNYKYLAKKSGFRWLGPEVPNVGTKTGWQCQHGHTWEATYNNIQRGTGCPYCAEKAPKTEDDYKNLSKERGFKWLGPKTQTTKEATIWECSKKHSWLASYNQILSGTGCPQCYNDIRGDATRLTPDDYHTIAEEKGLKWLGPEVKDTKTITVWQCAEGHKWSTKYNTIATGHGCPYCAGVIPKASDDYHALAQKSGFKWLGPEVPNVSTKTKWQCQHGHIWSARYADIYHDHGCPFCAGLSPKTPEDYYALAKQRGFKWLGPEVPNTKTKTKWQCQEGHIWSAKYNVIDRGSGCPFCLDMVHGVRVSKNQREIAELLKGKLNYPVGRYKIDIALLNIDNPVAIEYDSWFWHALKEKSDTKRDNYLISHGWKVLRVKSNELIPSLTQLNAAIDVLLAGESFCEIILEDWGDGPIFDKLKKV